MWVGAYARSLDTPMWHSVGHTAVHGVLRMTTVPVDQLDAWLTDSEADYRFVIEVEPYSTWGSTKTENMALISYIEQTRAEVEALRA